MTADLDLSPEAGDSLASDLRVKAQIIRAGERIAFGSETTLMEIAADILRALSAENARLTVERDEAERRGAWRPISSAPKDREDECGGPLIALASDFGHRAIGYWGRGLDGAEGWINPHDHLRMDYWNSFTHWMPLPPLPCDTQEGARDAGMEGVS